MICKKCGSRDVKNWPFSLYGRRGYMIHCVHCGKEYFRSIDEFAKDLKEETIMTAKECLVEFKRIIVRRTRSLMEIQISDA